MNKKLHSLRATFREAGNTITMQKITPEDIQVICEKHNKQKFGMMITVTQIREAVNNLELWDRLEMDDDAD